MKHATHPDDVLSCLFLARPTFGLIGVWAAVPAGQGAVCDRFFWEQVKRSGVPRAHSGLATLAFRTQYAVQYKHFGVSVPPWAKVLIQEPGRTRTRRFDEESAPKPRTTPVNG